MLRTPAALVPYALALACISAGGIWHAAEELEPGRVTTIGAPAIGGSFALIDQNGSTRTDADFQGKWMLVYFGYTHCPDVCPVTLTLMSQVMGRLGAKWRRIVPVFVTVDPERDTPEVLKQYLAAFDPHMVGLTGPNSHIASMLSAYHVFARRRPLPDGQYAVDHSNVIYLMDRNGKFAADYDNSDGPDKIADDLCKRL